MTSRIGQTFFQLLPTDLCADSNFRHAFLWSGFLEAVLTAASSGLAGVLAVSVYTQQPYIRLHTSFHPFLQASIFMTAAIALFIKLTMLVIIGAVIIVNDGEIFCACAREDLKEDMQAEQSKFTQVGIPVGLSTYKAAERDKQSENLANSARGNLDGRISLHPGSATFRFPERRPRKVNNKEVLACNMFQRAHQQLQAKVRQRVQRFCAAGVCKIAPRRKSKEQKDETRSGQSQASSSLVARRCFRRRQVSLNRLRHVMAVYPVVQLLTGAASMSFWFSSKEYHSHDMYGAHRTQRLSYKFFNSYVSFWAFEMVHTPLFLLLATWHYVRVDWQMQLLSASLFLDAEQRIGSTDGWNTSGLETSERPRQRTKRQPQVRVNITRSSPSIDTNLITEVSMDRLSQCCPHCKRTPRHTALQFPGTPDSLDIDTRSVPFSVPGSPISLHFNMKSRGVDSPGRSASENLTMLGTSIGSAPLPPMSLRFESLSPTVTTTNHHHRGRDRSCQIDQNISGQSSLQTSDGRFQRRSKSLPPLS